MQRYTCRMQALHIGPTWNIQIHPVQGYCSAKHHTAKIVISRMCPASKSIQAICTKAFRRQETPRVPSKRFVAPHATWCDSEFLSNRVDADFRTSGDGSSRGHVDPSLFDSRTWGLKVEESRVFFMLMVGTFMKAQLRPATGVCCAEVSRFSA